MPFTEQGFKNFQDYLSLVKANPGKTILQLMDGFKVAPLEAAGNKNPNNPNGFVYQGYTPHKPTDPGGDQSQGGDTYGPGGQPVPNALGWDSSQFGDQAYWNPTDTLPNGQTVSAHLDQLKNFNWPSYASKPSGTSFLQDIMAGIKSPGIAPVLGAAGIGSFLGGAGAAGSAPGWTSGYDLAGGGALEGMGGLPAQLPSFSGPQVTNAPQFGNPFDIPATAQLPGISGPQTTNAPPFGSPLDQIPATTQLPNISGPQTTNAPPVGNPMPNVPPGTQSALQKFLDGTADASDYAKLLGTIGATGLGVYSANQQTNSLKDLANKYLEFGAPSRARYEGSYAPGFSMQGEPGYKDALDSVMQSYLRKASTGGNPFDSPGVSQEILKGVNASLAFPALQNYRNQNASTGGYSAFNTAAPGAASAAIGSQPGALTNLAGGLSDILNPQPQSQNLQSTLSQLLGMFNSTNGKSL